MIWIILTILAIFSRAFLSIATRILSQDILVSSITQAWLMSILTGIITLFLSPFFGGIEIASFTQFPFRTLIIILSQTFGNILYFKGQKHLDAGTTQIAFSTVIIWNTILSIFILDSSFNFMQFLGIILMLFAILIIQKNNNFEKFHFDQHIPFIIVATILFAIFQVASAEISHSINTATYLFISYLGTALLMTLIFIKQIIHDFNEIKIQIKKTFIRSIFASAASLGYFIFSYLAYRLTPDRGVVVLLLTSQVVLSVLFGIIFLGEKENLKNKLAAGLLAFVASLLIKS